MFPCPTCDKSFGSKQKLGGHISSHRRGEAYRLSRGWQTVACATCGIETRNKKFCSTHCLHESQRVSTIKMHDGVILNITRAQLELYRANQLACEICGQVERRIGRAGTTTQLCIDHDHDSGLFRGLLCADCNRKLGWYEKHLDRITHYLDKGK